jgi:hypothetical protein
MAGVLSALSRFEVGANRHIPPKVMLAVPGKVYEKLERIQTDTAGAMMEGVHEGTSSLFGDANHCMSMSSITTAQGDMLVGVTGVRRTDQYCVLGGGKPMH